MFRTAAAANPSSSIRDTLGPVGAGQVKGGGGSEGGRVGDICQKAAPFMFVAPANGWEHCGRVEEGTRNG